MVGVCDQSLRIEIVSPYSFRDRHEEIDVETDSCNTDTSILLVGRDKVGIVMFMMVMRMPAVVSRVSGGSHSGGCFAVRVIP